MRAMRHLGRRHANWLVLAALATLVPVWCWADGFAVDGWVFPSAGFVLTMGVACAYRALGRSEAISGTMGALAQVIAFAALGAPLSYLVAMHAGAGLWDEAFARADRALGFDWPAYVAFVRGTPLSTLVLTVSYSSIMPQMVVLFVAFGLRGRTEFVERFVLAVMVSGLASIALSGLLPAFTMYEHLHLSAAELAPAVGPGYVETLKGLRAGTLRLIDLGHAEGIIAFPSYHAALAAVLIRAFWASPLLRWPGLALNLVVLASTPVDGGHYLADVLSGIAVGLLAWMAAGLRPSRIALPPRLAALGRASAPARPEPA